MLVRSRTMDDVAPPARPTSWRARGLSVAAAAPERLLLALLWFGYVAAIGYVTGLFRPVVVFPAALVVIVLTWRLHRDGGARRPDGAGRPWLPAAGALVAIVGVAVWFVLNVPYLSERVIVNRDPDVYTLAALWMRTHSSIPIPVPLFSRGSPGFGFINSTLYPQGFHLVSAVSASAGWVFGQTAVFWGNIACGAAALLSLYVLGTRVLGALWALVPVLALAASLPMLEFSRALYSEPLAMTFTFLGATLLWDAWQRDRVTGYVLAGAAFGGVGLARIDGSLPLIGVMVGLTVAAYLHPGRAESRRRWAALLVMAGSLPGLLLGLADGLLNSGFYVPDLRGQVLMLGAGLAVAAVLSLAGALLPRSITHTDRVATGLRIAATAGAALTAVALLVLISRIWWYVGHGPVNNGIIIGAQTREHLPVDGTQTYAEATFTWISWYYGWPVVLLGLAGLLVWLVAGARGRSTQLLWLSALFLPSAVLYLTAPNITPDQMWAMRRFLPVVVPGMLLGTTWLVRRLVDLVRARARRELPRARSTRIGGLLVAAALVLCAAGWPLITVQALWGTQNYAGALGGIKLICNQIDGRPTIVAGRGNYMATILVLCGVPTVSIEEPTPALLAQARQGLGGEAFLVTHAPNVVTWEGGFRPNPLIWAQREWETTVSRPPSKASDITLGVALGIVQPDGTVQPVYPP